MGFLPQSKSIYSAAWNSAFFSYGVGEEIQISLNGHEAKEFITGSETEYNPLECTRYIMWKKVSRDHKIIMGSSVREEVQ